MKALIQFRQSQKVEIYDAFANQKEFWISPFQQYRATIENSIATIETEHGKLKFNVSEIRILKTF